MIISEENHLAHYGILRRSGRYPWGSGDNIPQRSKSFLDYVADLRRQGLSDTEIARGMSLFEDGKPWTTTEFRRAASIAKNEKRAADVSQARRLKEKGTSNIAIGKAMGLNESTVRSLLKEGLEDKLNVLHTTANFLKDRIEEVKYLDVGAGNEHWVGVSRDKLDTAIALLKDEGYKMHYVKIPQLGTAHETTLKVMTKPGVPYSEVYANRGQIQQPRGYTEDGGRSFLGIHPPLSIDSKRIAVRYGEDGGKEADGAIWVRRGVEDVSIGNAHYAQVRIMVDGTHYIKGMAMYKDDLPAGADLVFNTPKSNTGNKLDVLKPLATNKEGGINENNPFGSIIRQRTETGPDGKVRVTSAMNLVGSPTKEGSGEEGHWDTWSRSLSSQFLSKQSPKLAEQQLAKAYDEKKKEFDEINKLTNPAVKKALLDKFAEDADAAAVHLKAAKMAGQSTHVILPIPSMKETEVYAPNFKNGERVVLIRHPHGGTFEIPDLVVNNKHPEAIKLLGKDAQDAIGINHKVAEHLSGADFDGDTVLVIPNNHRKIQTTPALLGLKGFDPQAAYPQYEGMHVMTSRQTQTEMGKISNLITDMTIKGAGTADLARAVRHSMVVIDAEKKKLNYKQSAIDNGIPQLKAKYQGGSRKGASTLISRKGQDIRVPERKQGFKTDPKTGEKIFRPTGKSFEKNGKVIVKTQKVSRLGEAKDARELVSEGGTKIESVYATHSNRLKSLGNEARLTSLHTPTIPYSPSAKKHYKDQVDSLTAKLHIAERNAPLERQAQVLANTWVTAIRESNPDMDYAEEKKVKAQALIEARTRTGAGKKKIEIEPKEWEAIQAGAISNDRLTRILKNSDVDQIKELATPKPKRLMTTSKLARAQSMLDSGHTQAEVAAALGVSLTTLKTSLSGG